MTWLWKVGADHDNIVSVTPVDGGWAVTSSLSDQPMMFLSGAQAEAKARSLAKLIAGAGGDAQVIVHDRRNALVGAVRYFAADDPGNEAALTPIGVGSTGPLRAEA